MRTLYGEISNKLDAVDFHAIWDGFTRYPFALYNDQTVSLKDREIPRDERFFGNTSIEFEQGRLAIWMVSDQDKEDSEKLAACLVHEMFHSHQQEKGERRYPNDLDILMLPDDPEYYRIKYLENRLLAAACRETDNAAGFLRRMTAVRLYRKALFARAVQSECLIETFEGLAEYAQDRALGQMSSAKYRQSINKRIQSLETLDESLFFARKSNYTSGACFAHAAGFAGLSIAHDIGTEERTVFELLREDITPAPPSDEYKTEVSVLLDAHLANKRGQIESFEKQGFPAIEGNYQIYGYDPMNMLRLGDKILCKTFVRLKNLDNGEETNHFGPALLYMRAGSPNLLNAYITL